ncbi:DUF6747 family protein [Spongiivirga citrea]|uniref:Uncharacterized protein n=1 Tax=Spongiivirga citrea TaxID=1481457 RepID=A0A6M0CGJ5_9FLAO|nr:DUF6747 family protein [Spongiivirga citrea]NER16955.1 hypothetical protein [Spongiivirga citrea]
MTTFLLFKKLYAEAFNGLTSASELLLKTITWFVLGTTAIGLFAFVFRIFTGFFTI